MIPFLVLVDSENSESALHAALLCSDPSTASDSEYCWESLPVESCYSKIKKVFLKVNNTGKMFMTYALAFFTINNGKDSDQDK